MFSCRMIVGAVALLVSTALPSWADDFALLLTNKDYARLPYARDADQHGAFKSVLERRGFMVFEGLDATTRDQARIATEFAQALRAGQVDRVVVVLAGHFVDGPSDSWLLANDGGAVNGLNVGQYGLSVAGVSAVLSEFPGKGLMVVTPSSAELPLGPGAHSGTDQMTHPQGVSVLMGPADRVLGIVRAGVLNGARLAALVGQATPGVIWSGYLPDLALGGAPGDRRPSGVMTDESYWLVVRDVDTRAAYRSYLNRFPTGAHANQARARIEAIRNEPLREAQEIEAALNLGRDARREIQRHLSLLGFDTRGIDGIFGPGSRAAIAAYQRSKGLPETGYLSGNLITLLRREAQARARQLDEEERERRLAQEREDRAFWQSVGNRDGEKGLRRYLRRYPDGIFADEARRRLAEIDERRRANADQRMRTAWDKARDKDTIAGYRDFIRRFPDGAFVPAAEDRITELEEIARNSAQIERDKAQEAQLLRNPALALLVEHRLNSRGYAPGVPDGKFDQDTRRALRKFQRASGMVVTGYVSQETLIRLMGPIVKN